MFLHPVFEVVIDVDGDTGYTENPAYTQYCVYRWDRIRQLVVGRRSGRVPASPSSDSRWPTGER
jgi:hypothetical protein